MHPVCRCHGPEHSCVLAEASILSPGILERWVLLNGTCLPLSNATLLPPVQRQTQGGVFSFMAAASWAFCSLYFRIFRWRL